MSNPRTALTWGDRDTIRKLITMLSDPHGEFESWYTARSRLLELMTRLLEDSDILDDVLTEHIRPDMERAQQISDQIQRLCAEITALWKVGKL